MSTKIIFTSTLVHSGDKNKIFNKSQLSRILLGLNKIKEICTKVRRIVLKKAVSRRLQRSRVPNDH
jgi:hypothetical protein